MLEYKGSWLSVVIMIQYVRGNIARAEKYSSNWYSLCQVFMQYAYSNMTIVTFNKSYIVMKNSLW